MFLDIEGVVAMIDGKTCVSLNSAICAEQNRDYNGWTSNVNRNLVLLWDLYGKIIDAVVNTPSNRRDSKSSIWCDIYEHLEKLQSGFKIICDSVFATKGNLQGKIVKLTDESTSYEDKVEYESRLTHLRRCSEWENQVLAGAF